MKLLSQRRVAIPKELAKAMEDLPENRDLMVFFDGGKQSITFSSKSKYDDSAVFIGKVHVDDKKNRFILSKNLYNTIPMLLGTGNYEKLYLCINHRKELCIKKAP